MLRLLRSRLAAWSGTDRALFALTVLALLAAPLRLAGPPRVASPHGESAGVSPPRRGLEPGVPSTLPPAPPHLAPEAITATVVAAPFRADRTAPPRRYQLGQPNNELTAPLGVAEAGQIPGYRLMGIAVASGAKLAVIDGATGRGEPRVYHLEESLGAYRLVEIGGDSVVVSGEDTTFVLKILRPWVLRDP